MLTSCQFMAEGAVRCPSGLLIPNAAQSRLESVCGERVAGPNSRVDFRSLSTCIRGRPPSVCGGGSLTGLRSCAAELTEKPIVAITSPKKNDALRFIGHTSFTSRRSLRLFDSIAACHALGHCEQEPTMAVIRPTQRLGKAT